MSDGDKCYGKNKSGEGRTVLPRVIFILVPGKDRLHKEDDIPAKTRQKGGALYTPRGKPYREGDKKYIKVHLN